MIEHWQQVLQQHWGISANLRALDGEFDLNILATGHQSYVLKVMRVGCAEPFIDLQIKAFQHILTNAPDIPVPAVVNTLAGAPFVTVPDAAGQLRIAWVLEKVEGIPYAQFKPHSAVLIHDIGAQVGAIDKALADFRHPELCRDFKWDLTKGDWIADHLDAITDPTRLGLIKDILKEFGVVKPTLAALPRVAIHNDVNDYNLK